MVTILTKHGKVRLNLFVWSELPIKLWSILGLYKVKGTIQGAQRTSFDFQDVMSVVFGVM